MLNNAEILLECEAASLRNRSLYIEIKYLCANRLCDFTSFLHCNLFDYLTQKLEIEKSI